MDEHRLIWVEMKALVRSIPNSSWTARGGGGWESTWFKVYKPVRAAAGIPVLKIDLYGTRGLGDGVSRWKAEVFSTEVEPRLLLSEEAPVTELVSLIQPRVQALYVKELRRIRRKPKVPAPGM